MNSIWNFKLTSDLTFWPQNHIFFIFLFVWAMDRIERPLPAAPESLGMLAVALRSVHLYDMQLPLGRIRNPLRPSIWREVVLRTIAHAQLNHYFFLILRIAIIFFKGVFRCVVQRLVFGVDVIIVFYEASDLGFVESNSWMFDIMSTRWAYFLFYVLAHVFFLGFYSWHVGRSSWWSQDSVLLLSYHFLNHNLLLNRSFLLNLRKVWLRFRLHSPSRFQERAQDLLAYAFRNSTSRQAARLEHFISSFIFTSGRFFLLINFALCWMSKTVNQLLVILCQQNFPLNSRVELAQL